jgi:Ca2+-transporting ATPase
MSRRLPTAELEPSGLSTEEAGRRLAEVGANEIQRAQRTSRWRLLARQLASPLIGLLLAAAAVSGFLGEVADAVAITTIVVLNALVGFFQEGRAENALLALRSMTAPRATVIRDGHRVEIAAAAVVPGDRLVLEAGDIVAADARLVEAHLLSTNEAALTGESAPVEKATTPVPADAPLAERFDRVFMGTSVAAGAARAEVLATGMQTELGRIAHLLASATDTTTPLQTRLARVSRTLLILCLGIVAVTAALGFVRGRPPPGGVHGGGVAGGRRGSRGASAIVTIALAIGVQRMAARHVLIRRLPAVETLGSATVICTDKTGTLTTGVMTVRELWGANHHELLAAAAACCDAELGEGGAPARRSDGDRAAGGRRRARHRRRRSRGNARGGT